jgi:TolB-like protein/class 3 adenylate cyclase/cytochrome c-type biogenesis protein CcmH/NrfG
MDETPIERRLAAILAADIAGYSRLMAADEVATVATLKAHLAVVLPLVESHGGRIQDTAGDGILAEFRSVLQAVECAVAIQRTMAERNAGVPQLRRMQYRIGVNLGDVIYDGTRVYGDGVNIAARLESVAEPGGICISEDAFRQIRGRLPIDFVDLGEQSLKNIRPLRVYRALLAPLSGEATASPAVSVPDKPSIAVMPFANMSGDPGQDYFADGITEDIITALSKLRWFSVLARNSSFPYKGRAVDVKQVGRELSVRYVLEGSVRRAGPQVRITAQLVDTVSGNHLWAERYDRQLADLFAVQDQITERVVAAIEPQLFAAEYIRGQRKPPESLDAWECVVRAMSCVAQGTGAGDAEAEALCRRAIAISPDYGQAHSLLAVVLLRRVSFSGDLKSALPEATASARTALRLDGGDSWAHLGQGMVFFRMRRHGDAVRAYRQALELNPTSALVHAALGHALAAQGVHEEAIQSAEHALRLSPSDARVGAQASHVLVFARFAARDYAESAALAQAMLARYPEYLPAHYVLVAANAMNGDLKAASEALATLLRLRPQFSLAGVCEIMPWTGEISERLVQGWHLAGVPPGG